MTMTPGEMLLSFRNAKKPSQQVKVLAELNLCSQQEVIDILVAQGVDRRQLPRGKRSDAGKPKPKKPKAEDPEEIEEPAAAVEEAAEDPATEEGINPSIDYAWQVLDEKIATLLARESDLQLEMDALRRGIDALYYAQAVLAEEDANG